MPQLVFSSAKIGARLPRSMKAADRTLLLAVAKRAINDLNSGDSIRATQGAKIWARALQNGDEDSPFLTCGKKCQHLLDEGNAPGYAVCYWACVIRGGDDIGARGPLTKALQLRAKNFINR